jgi:hypothetical protein
MDRFVRILQFVWASPNSLLGLALGCAGLLTGGRCDVRSGCLEFHGGLVSWLLNRLPTGPGTLAMTLGHTILGQSISALEMAREHEHVHVKQYQRWGPIFIPAYLVCSLYLWIRRRDAYRENPFEIEAYAVGPTPIVQRECE